MRSWPAWDAAEEALYAHIAGPRETSARMSKVPDVGDTAIDTYHVVGTAARPGGEQRGRAGLWHRDRRGSGAGRGRGAPPPEPRGSGRDNRGRDNRYEASAGAVGTS